MIRTTLILWAAVAVLAGSAGPGAPAAVAKIADPAEIWTYDTGG